MPLVPAQAEEADRERREEEEPEREAEPAGPRLGHQIGSLRKTADGRARRTAMTGRQYQGV